MSSLRLVDPGGAETYALTVAEQLARLGHEVVLHGRAVGEPLVGWADSRALAITDRERALPASVDGVIIGVDRVQALRMADRYPDAVRLFVPHSEQDCYLPPPAPGAVAATVALSDRQAERFAACVGAGEVVRLRQPIDLSVFAPRRRIAERPRRVLLLGNYHALPEGRGAAIASAWADAGLEWRQLSAATDQTLAVTEAIAEADIVVGYGRSALEGMACGRAVYVHDHSGTEGWLSAETYPALEAGGFAVSDCRSGRDRQAIRADLDAYSPELGQLGPDLARSHHDARVHASQLVALIERLRGDPPPAKAAVDAAPARVLISLAEAHLRAEGVAEGYRLELKRSSEAWAAERAALQLIAEEGQKAAAKLAALRATRRFRLMAAVMRPLDRVRGR